MRFQDVAVWSAIATTEVFGAAIANPMITPAPVIFPRQASSADSARSGTEKSGTANPNFIGYYMSLDGGLSSVLCAANSTYLPSGSFADCCSTGVSAKCSVASSCVDNSVMVGGGFTGSLTCGTGYACRTQTIYSAFSSPDAGYNLKILCANNYFTGEAIYRDIATSTSSSSTSTSSTSTSSTPSLAATTSTPGGVINQKSTSTSKAWIAGAVVGPVVGLAIIAGLIWFFLRRRRNQKHTAPVETGSAVWSPTLQSAVDYKTVPIEENEAVVRENRMSELPGSNVFSSPQPSELADNNRSYE